MGRECARQLIDAGNNVMLVEKNREVFQDASDIFGSRITFGDGCDPKVLERAGVSRARIIIALTGDDEDNLVVAELARYIYDVPLVLARVNRPDNVWLFTPQRGVDVAFCPACVVTELIKHEIDHKVKRP